MVDQRKKITSRMDLAKNYSGRSWVRNVEHEVLASIPSVWVTYSTAYRQEHDSMNRAVDMDRTGILFFLWN